MKERFNNERLKHDVALMMAQHCIELLGNLLREEDQQDARDEFYHVCKAGIECYLLQSDRLHHRLRPLDN